MKIRIEIDENLNPEEEVVVIKASSISEEVLALQKALKETIGTEQKLALYKQERVFYLSLNELLFFETEGGRVFAHTPEEMYEAQYRLYELEELLPGYFMRISKSTILNTRKVYSVSSSLPGARTAEFKGSYKQVYISRHYYKALQNKLEETR
ncbi:DNA-binding LytR/AlgR family response regulator [Lachnospiraceae bacterium PF1-22]|uniref:LytTR family DNA-binding domain-containing protein n=1 Tax=Ohessyouella blattaphilus TaxID=2949333 RepID=UPI003E1C87BE